MKLKKNFYILNIYNLKIQKLYYIKYLNKKVLIQFIYLSFEKNQLKKSILKGISFKITKKILIIQINSNLSLKLSINSPRINNIKLLK
uniref:Uncharacterized protein n=1 Tax=Nephromyces sp. ex Molgula occidentalis TaxID=2544991 RepID=A0A5C1H7K9_9APIC|nr:hypothetical protein [Nephromyces sp. ex Molgula occidentalis]